MPSHQVPSPPQQIEDIHLVRDKGSGKSKGFAFVKYEDQRSTVLAVDNFNGSKVRHSNPLGVVCGDRPTDP